MKVQPRNAIGRFILGHLLCAFALGGTALASPPPQAKTTYRVVNLVPGDYLSAAINVHGQVAYTVAAPNPEPGPGAGPISSWFYDGARSINIGREGRGIGMTRGVNDAGQVIGIAGVGQGQGRARIWSRRQGYTELGLLPATTSILAAYINNQGVVAGNAADPANNVDRAFRWSRSSGMEDLGALGQGQYSIAYVSAINDAGAITGTSWALESDYHAFLWTRATGMVDIHTNDSDDSTPAGISARGDVAGNYHYDGPDWRGYVWTPRGGMRDLNPGGVGTSVSAMSASGQVTGLIGSIPSGFHAMTWTRAGGLVDLGTLGGNTSNAFGANNRGQVIGYAETSTGGQFHAFVWNARDGMVDLNTRLRHAPPGLQLDMALAISDNGAIVARSNAGLVLLKPERGGACGCPHTVGPIAASEMVALGAPLEVSVDVAGDSPAAPYRVDWDWGDGSTASSARLVEGGAERRSSAVHSYATPGIHTVRATVVDRAGNSVAVSRKVVAWAPGRGIAAGAGAFASPYAGSKDQAVHPGPARFSFVAPLAHGALAGVKPALHFEAPGLHFVGAGNGTMALEDGAGRFEGSGAVNGRDGYRFRLAARASDGASGAPGSLALTIWRVDPITKKELIVYDNRDARGVASAPAGPAVVDGSTLAQGAIVLH